MTNESRMLKRLLALILLGDGLITVFWGPDINRQTVENVRRARLTIERVEDLGARGIFKLIVARVAGA